MALTTQQQGRVTDLQRTRDSLVTTARAANVATADKLDLIAHAHRRHTAELALLRAQLTVEGAAPGDLPAATPTLPSEFANEAAVDAALAATERGQALAAQLAGPAAYATHVGGKGKQVGY